MDFSDFLPAAQIPLKEPATAPEPAQRSASEQLEAAWAWFTEIPPGRFIWFIAAIVLFFILLFLKGQLCRLIRGKGEVSEVRKIFADLLSRTWSLFLLVASFAILSPLLALPPRVDTMLHGAFVILLALQVAIWASSLLTTVLLGYAERSAGDRSSLDSASTLLKTFVNLAVWAIAVLFILSNLGIDVTALVAGLGIGGIAIGLAAQGIFSDLFASLSIVLDKPFVKRDFITFGDYMGSVEKIGIKTTRIRALSGEQIIISNTNLLSERIRNYQRLLERRVVFEIGVVYQTPPEKLELIPRWIKEAIEAQEGTRFDRSHFMNYGDSALMFESVYFALTPDYNAHMDKQQAIYLAIFRKFAAEGVSFAYPTRTLQIEPAGAATEEKG
jgi:small-conductance mechanosensitive channel